jgi:hypothetical protein
MADQGKSRPHDDGDSTAPSPNPKDKKKRRDDNSDEESESMELVTPMKKLFQHPADNTTNNNNNTNNIWQREIDDASLHWEDTIEFRDLTPFSQDEMFGEGNSIHDLMKARRAFQAIGKVSLTTIAEWTTIIVEVHGQSPRDIEKATPLRYLFTRLALTDPIKLFYPTDWHENALKPVMDSATCWIACYLWFGAPWKDRDHWFPPAANIVADEFFAAEESDVFSTPPRTPPIAQPPILKKQSSLKQSTLAPAKPDDSTNKEISSSVKDTNITNPYKKPAEGTVSTVAFADGTKPK